MNKPTINLSGINPKGANPIAQTFRTVETEPGVEEVSRISFQTTKAAHKQLKQLALDNDVTVTDLIMTALRATYPHIFS